MKIVRYSYGTILLVLLLIFGGCSDGIEVRQDYDFELTTWYLPRTVQSNQQVEIRFTLKRYGEYAGTVYNLSYFQEEGNGIVRDTGSLVFENQERYDIRDLGNYDDSDPANLKFNLYYMNRGEKSVKLKFILGDNFGQMRELDIGFEYES